MSKCEMEYFLNIVNSYSDLEYLFSTILYSAGPTLVKEKPSSLLTFSDDNHHLRSSWEQYKDEVGQRLKVGVAELKKDGSSIIVLFYNKEILMNILTDERNIEFLKRFGYKGALTLEEYLSRLRERFIYCCPHEIGVFLGYPLEDVLFFINNSNEKCKLTGYWKVYGNIEEAKNTFNKYDKIRTDFMNLMISGIKPSEVFID